MSSGTPDKSKATASAAAATPPHSLLPSIAEVDSALASGRGTAVGSAPRGHKRPAAAAAAPSSAAKKKTPPSYGAATPTPAALTKKPYKGLRHFSLLVCQKVEQRGTTTYNQVADELVAHVVASEQAAAAAALAAGDTTPRKPYDEKNIRRRVYDALNVLMAMDIITKDNKSKAITWKGLPTSAHQDVEVLQRECDHLRQVVLAKRRALCELLVQQVCFRNLLEHNERREKQEKAAATKTAGAKKPAASKKDGQDEPKALAPQHHKIPLPFIIVNTHQSAVIQCNMNKDFSDVMFDFSQPFEINDDNTILKRLGMDKTTLPVLREMLPDDIFHYCQEHHLLDAMLVPDAGAATL